MKKVGIIGCGVIGGALKKWLEDNTEHQVFVSDPFKGYHDDMSQCDIFFIQIHVPTEVDGTQNLNTFREIISKLPDKPIFIRTTILPGTSGKLSQELNRHVYFMPEFLTERTSVDDFKVQPMVFTAETKLLKDIFPNKEYIEMSSLEAEITKYAHNVFGALKVTYFNAIYDYCQKLGANFNKVHTGCLLSGYINEQHSQVPGPDGKFGYGGKCFPKDVNAFSTATKGTPLGDLLNPLKNLNEIFRH
ncbi:MAG: UDP-glucose 6-dehydrogenase [Alphaproteobacteria bacterium]|nr:UDP-glucose 6-dehydrogenase [Alphaproteobacteria bacterium]